MTSKVRVLTVDTTILARNALTGILLVVKDVEGRRRNNIIGTVLEHELSGSRWRVTSWMPGAPGSERALLIVKKVSGNTSLTKRMELVAVDEDKARKTR